MLPLETPLDKLPLTKLAQGKLAKLGLKNLHDIVHYYPFRYEEFPPISPVKQARKNGPFTTKGQLISLQTKRNFKTHRTWLEGTIADPTGELKILWFNQPYLAHQLKVDEFYTVQGESKWGSTINPLVFSIETTPPLFYPVYSLTANVALPWLKRTLHSLIAQAEISEYFIPKLLAHKNFFPLEKALSEIHQPKTNQNITEAKNRLAWDEIFFYNLRTQIARQTMQQLPAPIFDLELTKKSLADFATTLPFELSPSQNLALADIATDLNQKHPMHRLLLGDVGSGKTVVACAAALAAFQHNLQSALLCPTTILAKQHGQTLLKFLSSFQMPLALLTATETWLWDGAETISDKKIILKKLASGLPALVIGTHALLEDAVKLPNLGLAIIDEQHRFGVSQRQILQNKRADHLTPHLLSLSATPIPRTLALTFFGDINFSPLDLPLGKHYERSTEIYSPTEKNLIYEEIKKTAARGEQILIVAPAILAETRINIKNIATDFKQHLPEITFGLLHGQLKAKEQALAMEKFSTGVIPALIATTMVEVGVHIENATLLVVFGAEYFGLAQLHQLRGRVGRGAVMGRCLCVPESDEKTEHERLLALKNHHKGQELAEMDLKFRGAGDMAGRRQTGFWDLKIATLDNLDLIAETQKITQEILSEDSELKNNPALAQEFSLRFSTDKLDKIYTA